MFIIDTCARMNSSESKPRTVAHLLGQGRLEGTVMNQLPAGAASHLSVRES